MKMTSDTPSFVEGDLPALEQTLDKTLAAIGETSKAADALRAAADADDELSQTAQGISLLDLKYHLTLMYNSRLVYYCQLRCAGQDVTDHSVLTQLVHIRTVLEKLRPVEKKMRYTINKLRRTAKLGVSQLGASGKADPLSYRPNPDALVVDDGDEDSELEDLVTSTRGGKDKGGGDGLYKPPKINPVHYDGDKWSSTERKRRREMEYLRRKALGSGVVQDMLGELHDRPEESAITGMGRALNNRLSKELKHQQSYEEENFKRVQLSKDQKRKRKRMEKEQDNLLSFKDQGREFDDLQAFRKLQEGLEVEEGGDARPKKRRKGKKPGGWKRKGGGKTGGRQKNRR